MQYSQGPKALRHVAFCALLLGVAVAARAAEPISPTDAALNLDQAVQALKDEVTQFNRDAQAAEDAFLYPAHSRLSIYVSNQIPNLLLTEISVTIDAEAPVTYRYDEFDARALLERDALQRLVHTNVGRGAHRIKVAYAGQFVDARKDAAPVSGRHEAVFDKGLEAAELEVEILRGARKGAPSLRVREWRAAEQ